MFIPSGYYRRKALAALKGHWQPALLVALIVNLPTLLMQGVSAFTNNDLLSRMESFIVASSRDGRLSPETLMGELNTILSSTFFWSIRGLEIVAMLITPCLALGMYKWLTDLIRGQEQPVGTVFSRMRYFFRAIGLQLMIILKVILWMLPGIAVSVLLLLPAFRAGTADARMAALEQAERYYLLPLLLTVIPGVMAALRYALSEYIMAEKPETRIMACIRRSKDLMKDQKRNLFLLMVSFILWYLLEMLVSSFLPGLVGLVFQMLAGLALNVYMAASVAVFYLRLDHAAETQESPDAEPEPEELN